MAKKKKQKKVVDRAKLFNRRALLLGGTQLGLLSLLVGRLYYLQVVDSNKYVVLAEENRVNLRLLAPPRGRIYDRYGVEIASNRQNYRVILVVEQARDVRKLLKDLSGIIDISEKDHWRVLRDAARKRAFVPILVRENLSWKEVSRIEVNAPDLPGVTIEEGQRRFYPYSNSAGHILGYVAAVSEAEQTGDPLLQLPDFQIGKNGIERAHDNLFRGKAGASQIEVNAVGRVIRELKRDEGTPGYDIDLTLDMGLQQYTYYRLGDESAAAVVMDIHTGELLAMASSPSFDPNDFADGIDAKTWKGLLDNKKAPLTNKTIAGQYAPGSTFKMVVTLAGLESGIIKPSHAVTCYGSTSIGRAKFHCWKRGGHGTMNLHNGIKQSCDVFFYDVARKVGLDRIAEMANRLGIGVPLPLGLRGEKKGFMPTREWKQAQFGERWQHGETLVAGIGQGFILATPLQLAVMTARIVNGGKAVMPQLLRRQIGPDGSGAPIATDYPDIGISQASRDAAIRGMIGVVNEPRGTAGRSRITEEGMEMGGKTGTSQVRRISKAERATGVVKNKDKPWEERDHALFIGFAPIHDPRYACAVIVEHGGGGSRAAAPIAKDVLLETQRRDPSRTSPLSSLALAAPIGQDG
ncbi:MAG: penicillin-binding protein 2 [Alphaproteobacteria bacterium]|nr:penicillin-binding protein 2 [Alphaproteobacteria bacterium]